MDTNTYDSFKNYSIGERIRVDQFYEYRIIDIKEGGMALVLILERLTEAPFHDLLHRKKIAIKTFKQNFEVDKNLKLFEHELRIWINLESSNIVPLLKIITLKNNLFAIMPYYEGSLREIMAKEGRLNESQSLTILENTIDGLYHPFKKYGIVHQDIKPENILSNNTVYKDDNRYFVSDWGIANLQRFYYPKVPDVVDKSSTFFETLSRMGTLPYMSPERLLGHFSSVESDIYSLGIIFFEMLYGHLPFNLYSDKDLPYQVMDADYYYTAEELLNKSYDNKISKLILKCIYPDIKKRYHNYDKLIKDLNKLTRKGWFR